MLLVSLSGLVEVCGLALFWSFGKNVCYIFQLSVLFNQKWLQIYFFSPNLFNYVGFRHKTPAVTVFDNYSKELLKLSFFMGVFWKTNFAGCLKYNPILIQNTSNNFALSNKFNLLFDIICKHIWNKILFLMGAK